VSHCARSLRNPAAGPWHAERLAVVAGDRMRLGREWGADDRPVVLANDGRRSGGKTTLAGRLGDAGAGSTTVHPDDVAWLYSMFGWAELLINGCSSPAAVAARCRAATAPGRAESGPARSTSPQDARC
jgi:hypothetical protein